MSIRLRNFWLERLMFAASVMCVLCVSTCVESSEGSGVAIEQRIGNGDPLAGKRKARAENCLECHGEEGISSVVSVPRLAGQYADYIVKQLKNFQSGERKHPVMNAMADGLTDDDLADIAAYFAGHPTMQGDGSGESQVARELFVRGDMARNILPCKSCHGETGEGKFSISECYPAIGGQHRIYLREQLLNWRKAERTNSPSGVMNVIAKSLSDAEIEALAGYISGL